MSTTDALRGLTSQQRKTFLASFLGWTLDAFDFFLVIVTVPHIAKDFHSAIKEVAVAVTITLMLRPLGALIFGWFADRYGRRVPLMVDVALYSVLELATAFSPNLTVFIVLRALYGIAMGGEWGLGAALAMEVLPAEKRGLFSGILQEGYAVGYLLAAVVLAVLYVHIGWRGMFMIGVLPALLIFFIRRHVPESPAWLAGQAQKIAQGPHPLLRAFKAQWPLFIYAILFMAAFNYMSHGTQDLYPTFLTLQHGFTPALVGTLTAIMNAGAIAGGVLFGWLSQRFGRRSMIMVCAALGVLLIPLWAFSQTAVMLAIGGFLMQVAVQGAWGIIPAHLNEISPQEVRGTFPGFTYQLGNLISANALQLESAFAAEKFPLPSGHPDYAKAMAVVALIVFAAILVLTAIGRFVTPERREIAFAPAATASE
ncbi:MAG TPA: MFS transporter [Candidatus Baltobacteraceae bacterium]|nr:MFS transporter [Candidatus Baltobacteraceae bacterium]